MNTTLFIRRTALATLALAVAFSLLAFTPQGRALAQSLFRFFTPAESDSLPAPTEQPLGWVEVTPGAQSPTITPAPTVPGPELSATCGDFQKPTCSVEQIRNLVAFTIKEPASLPADIYFSGATGDSDRIFLLYNSADQSGGMAVIVEPWADSPEQTKWDVGVSAVIEQVQIGQTSGEYVRGSFSMQAGDENTVWDENAGVETLRWVDGGSYYTMQYFSQNALLGKAGLTHLAENMTTDPVAKLPLPTVTDDEYAWDPKETYPLSIAEAEELAGFKLHLPTHLPAILSLVGAEYQPEPEIVAVFHLGPYTDGLRVSQQLSSDPLACELCDIRIGSNQEMENDPLHYFVGPTAKIETVQIGDVTGKYVEGVWQGTDCCGWEWSPDPYLKTLRWWKDGKAFELIYFGMDIEKSDMIKIAESMK